MKTLTKGNRLREHSDFISPLISLLTTFPELL